MFLPYGYFASYYLNNKKLWPTALLTIIVSFTIETVQLKIGRTFDVDDIILNTCGGIIGGFIYSLSESVSNKLPKVLKTEGFINFIVIITIILLIIYLFNINVLGWFNYS